MATKFVEFSQAEFEAAVPLPTTSNAKDEVVYEETIGSARIRVYSSLDRRTGRSRDCGEDAIRLVLLDATYDVPIIEKQPRVYRSAAAGVSDEEAKAALFSRLASKIDDLRKLAAAVPACPQCGGSLYEKGYTDKATKQARKFWACAAWKATGCKGGKPSQAAQKPASAPRPVAKVEAKASVQDAPQAPVQSVSEALPATEATDEELIARYSVPGFTPSRYQARVPHFIENETGNALVDAVAGSGKTTTLVHALRTAAKVASHVLFVAFNKVIADELRSRVPEGAADVRTLNSLGFRALMKASGRSRLEVTGDRLRNIVREILRDRGLDTYNAEVRALGTLSEKIVSLARATLTDLRDRNAVVGMVDAYGLDSNGALDAAIEISALALDKVVTDPKRLTTVDFDDQVHLPVALGLPVEKYDFIFVDECQDLNLAQIRLIQAALSKSGRIVCVGDPYQAIYQFRGADQEAVPRLVRELNLHRLPLSICYRCPRAIVDVAREFVPHIEAAPNAEEGIVEVLLATEIEKARLALKSGDAVLCRQNAPLVSVAFSLIRRGQKAVIRGRDIGKGLTAFVEKIGGLSLVDFISRAHEYQAREVAKLEAQERDAAIDALNDKIETIYALTEGINTISDLTHRIESVFSDEKSGVGVVCSSIHKAKGLEWDHVSIIEPQLLNKARKANQAQAERNVAYVAITRARKRLTFWGAPNFRVAETTPQAKPNGEVAVQVAQAQA